MKTEELHHIYIDHYEDGQTVAVVFKRGVAILTIDGTWESTIKKLNKLVNRKEK